MIHARVQHHPSRVHLLPDLVRRLEPLAVEVVEHSSDPPSPWAGYRRCLDDIPDCSHLLIVQDDAQPVPNFAAALVQIAATLDVPVCLFLARLPRDASALAERAMKQNRRYVTVSWRTFMPIVAVLWPREKAIEFRDWADEHTHLPGTRGEPRSDDAMAGRWKMVNRETVLACVPSIVEHPDEVESTIGRRAQWGKDKNRVACLLAEDALDYDWTRAS